MILYFHRPDPPSSLPLDGCSWRVYRKASRYYPTKTQQYIDQAIKKNPYASAKSFFDGMKLFLGASFVRMMALQFTTQRSSSKPKLAEKVKKEKRNRIAIVRANDKKEEGEKEEHPPSKKLKDRCTFVKEKVEEEEVESDSDIDSGGDGNDDSDGEEVEEEGILTDDDESDDGDVMED